MKTRWFMAAICIVAFLSAGKVHAYYSISPYAYAANNPVRFIDPDGREVRIYYEDEDGNEQSLLYTAGMQYSGSNAFVAQSVSYLNAINDNGGNTMLGELISSANSFNVRNQVPTDNNGNPVMAMQFNEFASGGGDIFAGIMINMGDYTNIEGMSHELFHGLQHEKGQGGASVFNEVEAFVFGSKVAKNWLRNSDGDYMGGMSANGAGNGTPSGVVYSNSFDNLSNSFSNNNFTLGVLHFKTGSASNTSGLYNNYPLRRSNQRKSILKSYYP